MTIKNNKQNSEKKVNSLKKLEICNYNNKGTSRFKQNIFVFSINFLFIWLVYFLLQTIYQIIFQWNCKNVLVIIIFELITLSVKGRIGFLKRYFNKFEMYRWYDSFKIVSEDGPLDQEKTIYPYMPHCIFVFTLLQTLCFEKSPFNAPMLVSRFGLCIPLLGAIARSVGIQSVDAFNFKKLMNKNKNILFIPGGFEECHISDRNIYRIYADRYGFIKYALKYGYCIRPVFAFQEGKGYITTDKFLKLRVWIGKMKLPNFTFMSKYLLAPGRDLDATIVVGKHIQLPQLENPTQEDINKYHVIFLNEIRQLFERNVDEYDKGSKLIFWSEDKSLRKL